MANRLKALMGTLISENQSAFIPGRVIQDTIIIDHEYFHAMKKTKKGLKGFMALKLDMMKAYDKVE